MEGPTPMTNETYPDTIIEMIANAHHAAEQGDMQTAVRWFDLCRTKVMTLTPQKDLRARIDADTNTHATEAEKVRADYLKQAPFRAKTKIAIFSDSLGLPRPNEYAPDPQAIDKAYPGVIRARIEASALGSPRVDSYAQRFLTTDGLVDMLPTRGKSLNDAHVLVHLGLNDCVARIFMTDQRLGMDLLPKETTASMVDFARKYRVPLILAYPEYKYVPLPRFVANLHKIAAICRAEGALSLTFSTITVVPLKFWHATPHQCRNFTAYNLAIMDAAAETDAKVLDVDRLMWSGDPAKTLNPDGMHLSHHGHTVLADAYVKMALNI